MKFIKAAATVFALMMTGSVYAAEVITETEHLGNWKINYVYTDAANKELLRGYISDKNSSLIDNSTQYYEGEHGLSLMHLKNQKIQDTYVSALTSIDSSYLKPNTTYRLKFVRRTRMAFESQIRIIGGVIGEVTENVNIEWGQGWTEYTYDFTTLPETSDVDIEICLLRGNHEYGGAGLYIDNVSLYEIDGGENNVGENLIENGDFEGEVITEPAADNVENASAEGRIASAYITWNVPADEDYKQARIYMVTDGEKQLLASAKPGVNSYLAEGLENGTEYSFLIVSLDKRFNESEGITVTCTTVPSPDAPDVSADDENNEIIGIDSTMEYKIDIGGWYTYGESDMPDLSGNHIVYVRVKETEAAPVGFSKVLLFTDSAAEFEPSKVNFTKTELKNTQLIIEGTVPDAPDANVLISLTNADSPQTVMFIKQVKTDDDGKFSYTAVMNDYVDENGFAYMLTGEENTEHTDLSGIYILKANSDKGLISDSITVYFGNSVSRKKAVEVMKNAESETDIESLFAEHKNALSALGFDTEKFADDESYRSCIAECILSGGMDDIENENEMLEAAADCNLVYALDIAENAAAVQKLILENESKIGFDYKGESFRDIVNEGKQARIEWFFERILADNFSSLNELREKFVQYGALYDINTATYMMVADVLEENIKYFSPDADEAYEEYEEYNSQTAVNKAIISYIKNNGKLTCGEDISKCLEEAVKEKDEEKTTGKNSYSGGGGGSGGGGSFAVTNTSTVQNEKPEQTAEPSDIFTDMSQAEWARTAIESLHDKNIISGFGDGTVRPNENITREQFVKMLVVAFGISTDAEIVMFDDMADGAWYVPYISAAYNTGIVKGIDDNNFGIGRLLTREDMAALIYRTMEKLGDKPEGEKEFADKDSISDYAKEAVSRLAAAGIITGMGDNNFMPCGNATRAQSASIIYRAMIR